MREGSLDTEIDAEKINLERVKVGATLGEVAQPEAISIHPGEHLNGGCDQQAKILKGAKKPHQVKPNKLRVCHSWRRV
jgi:hypothetical protein